MQEGINKPARSWQPLRGFPKLQHVVRGEILPSTCKETTFSKSCRLHGDNSHTQQLLEPYDYKKNVIFKY